MKIFNHFLAALVLISCSISCTQENPILEKFEEVLQLSFQEHPGAYGIMLHVESPGENISWTSCRGFDGKSEKRKLACDQPVLIASNTKTYVAASILKLVEMGMFSLDDPIKDLLLSKTSKDLIEVGYQLDSITIRHLLSHTSGIHDYVTDSYFEFVHNNRLNEWSKAEQINKTLELGSPQIRPGVAHSYGDINFVLLCEIIEKQMEIPFYNAIRKLIGFENLGLTSTWFEGLEKQPEQSTFLAHQYWDKRNWDSKEMNPSWDLYGGGGLASNTKDLALFFQYLFEGKIIDDRSVLKEMYSFVLPKEESVYCLGLQRISFNGRDVYYHGGFWGTDVMYIPQYNMTISAFTLNKDKRALNAEISENILKIIETSIIQSE